jgi:hypothetical protein
MLARRLPNWGPFLQASGLGGIIRRCFRAKEKGTIYIPHYFYPSDLSGLFTRGLKSSAAGRKTTDLTAASALLIPRQEGITRQGKRNKTGSSKRVYTDSAASDA